MKTPTSGIVSSLKSKARAHAAALSHGVPAKKVPLIVITGHDGSHETVAFLASILRQAGKKIGVITPQYIEIASGRVEGSQHADVAGDAFRLQGLLSQMRKAACDYILLELPAGIPSHGFTGIPLHMVVMRRCGDAHFDAVSSASQREALSHLLARKPHFVVMNRDDICFGDIIGAPTGELTMSYGTHEKAECRITSVQLHPKGSAVKLLVDHQTELTLTTELPGKQIIYSAVAAAAAAYLLHVPVVSIEEGVATLEPLDAHFEYLYINRPYKIVLDSAITPDGIHDALETLKHFTSNRIIAVLSAGSAQLAHWRPIIGEIVGAHADRVIVTDGDWAGHESPQTVRDQLMQGVLATGGEAKADEIPDRQAAIEKAMSIARRGDTIVVCCIPLRSYRQYGVSRHTWNDKMIIEELLQS